MRTDSTQKDWELNQQTDDCFSSNRSSTVVMLRLGYCPQTPCLLPPPPSALLQSSHRG